MILITRYTYHQSQLKSSWLKMVPLGQRKDTGYSVSGFTASWMKGIRLTLMHTASTRHFSSFYMVRGFLHGYSILYVHSVFLYSNAFFRLRMSSKLILFSFFEQGAPFLIYFSIRQMNLFRIRDFDYSVLAF